MQDLKSCGLRITDKSLLTLGSTITVSNKILKNREDYK